MSETLMSMHELRRDLLTTKYTRGYRTDAFEPSCYKIVPSGETGGAKLWEQELRFQTGPIKEAGVNGVCDEDLLNIVCDRLETFQTTDFACRENALAITAIEEALLWMRKRTMGREARGVEGTHEV